MASKQSNTQANKKRAKEANREREGEQRERERERANNTARVKWGRGKREANGK